MGNSRCGSSIIDIEDIFFEKAYNDPSSSLYQYHTVYMESASGLYSLADELKELADETDADVFICTSNRKGLAYVFSTLLYDENIVFYGWDMDRRAWVYDALSVPGDYRILFYKCDDKDVLSAICVDTEGESVIDYLKNKMGIERKRVICLANGQISIE